MLRLFLLLLGMGIPQVAVCQYVFHQIDIRDGLPDNYVRTILRDQNGLMWFGTQNGLCRYDGYYCQPYAISAQGQRDDNLKRVEQDAGGQIWITTFADGLYWYNAQTDRVEADCRAPLARLGIALGREKPRAFVDADCNLWVVVGRHIYYYTFAQHRLYHYASPRPPRQITSDGIRSFVLYADGEVAEVVAFSGKLRQVGRVELAKAGNTVMYQDGQRALWFYDTYEAGLYRLDLMQTGRGVQRVSDENVTSMVTAADGRLWVGTNSSGVVCMDGSGRWLADMKREADNSYSLVSNHVNCLYLDSHRNLWVGTSKAGVAYANLDHHNVQVVKTPYLEDISCFLSDGDQLWVGYDGKGLARLHADGSVAAYYSRENGALGNNLVIGASRAPGGEVWFATYGGGVMRWQEGRMASPAWGKSPAVLFARHVEHDGRGNMWIGSVKAGLTMIDRQGRMKTYTFQNSALHTNAITDLGYAAKQQRLYVASSTGLCYVDRDMSLKAVGKGQGEEPRLADLSITTMLVTAEGWLWIGTPKGLEVYTPTLRQAVVEGDELPTGPVQALTADRRGNVWLTTTDKVVQLAPAYRDGRVVVRVRSYSANEGTAGMAFCKYALYCTPQGDILAGGTGAFVRIRPSYKWLDRHRGTLVFTQLHVGNQRVQALQPTSDGRTLLRQPLRNTDRLELRWDDDFTVEVSALDYGNSNVRYDYRIDDGAWVRADGNRIHFSHLASGTHRLQVRTRNGNADASGAMTIVIAPPFWRSVWAYLIYMMLLGALAIAVWRTMRRRRMVLLRRRAVLAEQAERRRVDEAKMRFITNVGHDLRTPLSLIISPVELLLQKGTHPEVKSTLDLVLRHARQLLDQLNLLLDMRHLENHEEKLTLTEGDLTLFVADTCDPYRLLAEKSGIRLVLHQSEPHVVTSFDSEKLRRVVVNLLSNALKYNHKGGTVDIDAWHDGASVHICVADTGMGIRPENRERIFERFFQEQHDGALTGSGIGLHIVKQYVDLMGGTIAVTDNVPRGTVFTVTLPMAQLSAQQPPTAAPTVETEEGETSDVQEEAPARKTILVVEDNDDFRQFIVDVLRDDYFTLEAADGRQALDMLAQQRADMVISDVMMPVMDGMQLCQRIKTDVNLSHIPVVLLTAKTADEHVISGYREGADDYITKPFNPAILKIRIHKIFDWMEVSHEQIKDPATRIADLGLSEIDRRLLEQATRTVESRLADSSFGVEEFSQAMNMSRSALYKKLMAVTGRAPLEFIRTIQLREGYRLLMRGEGNISEVAYRVGLSPKQFARFFKETYGVLPSKLRSGSDKEGSKTGVDIP